MTNEIRTPDERVEMLYDMLIGASVGFAATVPLMLFVFWLVS